MREEARIDRILIKIKFAWHLCPDLRLNQLVEDIDRLARPVSANSGCENSYYIEDDRFEERLDKFILGTIVNTSGSMQINKSHGVSYGKVGDFRLCYGKIQELMISIYTQMKIRFGVMCTQEEFLEILSDIWSSFNYEQEQC